MTRRGERAEICDGCARDKRAAALGYQVALVKTPYYYKPAYSAEAYVRHYRSVADASPIPVLLYSVPIFTGVTLETPEILALADHPKPSSLDYWLRENFAKNKEVRQASSEVVRQLVATYVPSDIGDSGRV